METYTLQYASDLHLNDESPPFHMLLEPVASELALCGDIGNPYTPIYANFLKWCSKHWSKVYLLSGNHEYFNEHLYTEVDLQIRAIAQDAGPNILFLQNETVTLEKYKIIIVGSTLWSLPAYKKWDKLGVNFIGNPGGKKGEYNAMFTKDEYTGRPRLVHPSDIMSLCLKNIAYIRNILKHSDGWRVIILSHHMPSFQLIDEKHKNGDFVTTYAVDLDILMQEPLVAWICGHSHTAKTLRFDTGAVSVLNPLGYKNQVATSGYSRKAVIQVYRENIAIPRVL